MMRATKFKTLMMKSRSCGTDLEVTTSHNKHLANFFFGSTCSPSFLTLDLILLAQSICSLKSLNPPTMMFTPTIVSIPHHPFQALLFLPLDEVGVRSRLILALFSIFVAFLPLALHLGLMCSESGDSRVQRTFWAWSSQFFTYFWCLHTLRCATPLLIWLSEMSLIGLLLVRFDPNSSILLATTDEVDVIVSASAAAEAALSWLPRDANRRNRYCTSHSTHCITHCITHISDYWCLWLFLGFPLRRWLCASNSFVILFIYSCFICFHLLFPSSFSCLPRFSPRGKDLCWCWGDEWRHNPDKLHFLSSSLLRLATRLVHICWHLPSCQFCVVSIVFEKTW